MTSSPGSSSRNLTPVESPDLEANTDNRRNRKALKNMHNKLSRKLLKVNSASSLNGDDEDDDDSQQADNESEKETDNENHDRLEKSRSPTPENQTNEDSKNSNKHKVEKGEEESEKDGDNINNDGLELESFPMSDSESGHWKDRERNSEYGDEKNDTPVLEENGMKVAKTEAKNGNQSIKNGSNDEESARQTPESDDNKNLTVSNSNTPINDSPEDRANDKDRTDKSETKPVFSPHSSVTTHKHQSLSSLEDILANETFEEGNALTSMQSLRDVFNRDNEDVSPDIHIKDNEKNTNDVQHGDLLDDSIETSYFAMFKSGDTVKPSVEEDRQLFSTQAKGTDNEINHNRQTEGNATTDPEELNSELDNKPPGAESFVEDNEKMEAGVNTVNSEKYASHVLLPTGTDKADNLVNETYSSEKRLSDKPDGAVDDVRQATSDEKVKHDENVDENDSEHPNTTVSHGDEKGPAVTNGGVSNDSVKSINDAESKNRDVKSVNRDKRENELERGGMGDSSTRENDKHVERKKTINDSRIPRRKTGLQSSNHPQFHGQEMKQKSPRIEKRTIKGKVENKFRKEDKNKLSRGNFNPKTPSKAENEYGTNQPRDSQIQHPDHFTDGPPKVSPTKHSMKTYHSINEMSVLERLHVGPYSENLRAGKNTSSPRTRTYKNPTASSKSKVRTANSVEKPDLTRKPPPKLKDNSIRANTNPRDNRSSSVKVEVQNSEIVKDKKRQPNLVKTRGNIEKSISNKAQQDRAESSQVVSIQTESGTITTDKNVSFADTAKTVVSDTQSDIAVDKQSDPQPNVSSSAILINAQQQLGNQASVARENMTESADTTNKQHVGQEEKVTKEGKTNKIQPENKPQTLSEWFKAKRKLNAALPKAKMKPAEKYVKEDTPRIDTSLDVNKIILSTNSESVDAQNPPVDSAQETPLENGSAPGWPGLMSVQKEIPAPAPEATSIASQVILNDIKQKLNAKGLSASMNSATSIPPYANDNSPSPDSSLGHSTTKFASSASRKQSQSMTSLTVPGLSPNPLTRDSPVDEEKLSMASRRESTMTIGSKKSVDYRDFPDTTLVILPEVEEKPKSIKTNDETFIRNAIPYLPLSLAVACLILNIIVPGSGTVLGGLSILCCGQPRVSNKSDQIFTTLCANILVGLAQLFTITFLLVGWFWSIVWGIHMVSLSAKVSSSSLVLWQQQIIATPATYTSLQYICVLQPISTTTTRTGPEHQHSTSIIITDETVTTVTDLVVTSE